MHTGAGNARTNHYNAIAARKFQLQSSGRHCKRWGRSAVQAAHLASLCRELRLGEKHREFAG